MGGTNGRQQGSSTNNDRFSYTPPTGCGNSNWGYVSTKASYDVYKNDKLKVTPSVTATPYYSNCGNGIDKQYGISVSYNIMGGK